MDENDVDSLPTSTDIKEWNKLKSFTRTFVRTQPINLTESSIDDIKTISHEAKTPMVLALKVSQFNTIADNIGSPLQILFGMRDYAKLLNVKWCGMHYFHGYWYLIMTDLYYNPTLLNDDEDIVYVGVGFEKVRNEAYHYHWGRVYLPDHHTKYDQGHMLVTNLTMFYPCSNTYRPHTLGAKPV
jgi:hypothetical protein